jgi:hypothetical protein
MKSSPWILGFVLFTWLVGGQVGAQDLSMPPSESCSAVTDAVSSILLPLEIDLPAGSPIHVEVVIRTDAQERFRERQALGMPATRPAVFTAWLGGLGETLHRRTGAETFAEMAEVDILVDGRLVTRTKLSDLVGAAVEWNGDNFAPIQPDALSGQSRAATSFTCPNSTPFCQDQYDYCYEVLCEFGNRGAACIQSCATERDECILGARTTYTTKTLQATQRLPSVCGFYPWYTFLSPRIWLATQARYLNQEYESISCQTSGETFVTLIRQWTTTPICYTKTSSGCSGNAFDLSSDCRW